MSSYHSSMKTAYFFSILILVANLLMISQFGTDVPFWDQWDSEAELYLKWEDNSLTLMDLFTPHVQHRFAVSRIFRLALYELLGGWSPVSNMIFQSFLVPLIFLVFFLFVREKIQEKWKCALFYSLSTAVFIFPMYWEAILLGFQSHFYLSIIFALVLILLATRKPDPKTFFWFSMIGLVNSFTSASNLTPLLVCLFVQLISLARFRQWRQSISYWMIGTTVLLIILNINLLVFPESQRQFAAHGFTDLVWLSLQAFSWPVDYLGIFSLWVIPATIVVYKHKAWTTNGLKTLKNCITRDRSSLALFGFLLWLILSIGSIAYARGNYALFASRYLNIYAFTLYSPLLLYLLFFDGILKLHLKKRASQFLLIVFCLLTVGWFKEGYQELQRCSQYKTDMDIIKNNLVTASRLNSPQYLYEQQKIKYTYGAHPNPGKVFAVMKHPSLWGKHLWLPDQP